MKSYTMFIDWKAQNFVKMSFISKIYLYIYYIPI